MFAPVLLSCLLNKISGFQVKFSGGAVLESGVVHNKTGDHPLDLEGFLSQRIAGRIKGSADKTANDLEYQKKRGWVSVYLFQVVPVSKDKAIGIIGYPVGDKGYGDAAHDLVSISVGGTPAIRMIRTLPMPLDGSSSMSKPRLFWSKGRLLLRMTDGFEVIDNHGRKVGKIRHRFNGLFVGRNSGGRLVFAQTQEPLGISLYNVQTGRTRSYPLKVSGYRIDLGSVHLYQGKVNFQFYVTDGPYTPGKPSPKQTTHLCSMDAASGKILSYKKLPQY